MGVGEALQAPRPVARNRAPPGLPLTVRLRVKYRVVTPSRAVPGFPSFSLFLTNRTANPSFPPAHSEDFALRPEPGTVIQRCLAPDRQAFPQLGRLLVS